MLQLVLGRSGSGKTQWIYERLSALVDTEEDRPLLCVVPEPVSYTHLTLPTTLVV